MERTEDKHPCGLTLKVKSGMDPPGCDGSLTFDKI